MKHLTQHTCSLRRLAGLALLMVVCAISSASAMFDRYDVYATTGKPTDMSDSTKQIFGPNLEERASPLLDIGFDFYIDGKKHTQFSVSTAGLISFDVVTESDDEDTHQFPDNKTLSNHLPMIAAYWGEDLGTERENGKIHYRLTGSAPFRVLTIEWFDLQEFRSSSKHFGTFQVRLYETTNRVEFWYGAMKGSSSSSDEASIGIAADQKRYLQVLGNQIPREVYEYPDKGENNDYFLSRDPIRENTLYVFQPCSETLWASGDVSQGGTTDLDHLGGDLLLSDEEVMRGSTDQYRPVILQNVDFGCEKITYKISFSGPNAGDYFATGGTIGVGERFAPVITFTPSGSGDRLATMTITTSKKQTISFALAAEGLTRIDWIGNIGDGGVTGLPNGADLMTGIDQPRGTSDTYTPITLENLNNDPRSTKTTIRYRLNDPFGSYAISFDGKGEPRVGMTTISETIGPSGSSTPVITFAPHVGGEGRGTGPQPATLTVEVDQMTRVFDLRGFSVEAALEYFAEGERLLTSNRALFTRTVTCLGEEITSIPITLDNVNRPDVTITSIDILQTESKVRQGVPSYPLELDPFGNPIDMVDYFITEGPAVIPVPANRMARFPITIEGGESKTLYLNYIGQRPERRFARMIVRSNAVNTFETDIDGYLPTSSGEEEPQEGIFTLQLFGKSVGGQLASSRLGGLEQLALTFDPLRIGQSGTTTVTLYNTGECELRIDPERTRLAAGDISEFEIVDMFAGLNRDSRGNWVLPSGASTTVEAEFAPRGTGSRRATMMVATSDSTLYLPGVSERGVYYMDLYGVGEADLAVEDLQLDPTIIGGTTTSGTIALKNESGEVIEIAAVRLVGQGVDDGEITESTTNPWTTFPASLEPLGSIELEIDFAPDAAIGPGARSAMIEVELVSGTIITARIDGLAGTRVLAGTPPVLFAGEDVSVGETARAYGVITNTGSFPIRIADLTVTGAAAADYTITALPRTTIDAGGSEFIEVTYLPSAAGSSDATLTVTHNGTNPPVTFTLSGAATTSIGIVDPVSGTMQEGINSSATREAARGISSVASGTGEMTLGVITPNPVRRDATLAIELPQSANVQVDLYDSKGAFITRLVDRELGSGDRLLRLDIGDRATGTYFLRVTSPYGVQNRTLRFVR